MRGGGTHRGSILVAAVACAVTGIAVLVVPSSTVPPAPPTELATSALTGQGVNLAATRDVPVRAPLAVFTDPQRGVARDAMGFVEAAFVDLLGRPPGASSLAQWTDRLELGGPRTALTTMAITSTEYRSRKVARLYREYLDRDPRSEAAAHWTALLDRGHPTTSLRSYLLGSSEYFNRPGGGGVESFVEAVYHDVLGRPPGAASVAHWSSAIRAGQVDRTGLAEYLLASGEGRRRLASTVYVELLGREATPAEEQHWATLLSRGLPEDDVTAAVAASAEYYERLPTDYTATIDWGDGTTGAASVRRVGSDGLEITAARSFSEARTFNVTVTLQKEGAESATATTTVAVEAPSNERFAAALYLDVLERRADAAGLAGVTRALTDGGQDARRAAALWMLGTGERRRLVVGTLYERYLDRIPSPDETAWWAAGLAGLPVDWLRTQLLGSSEYFRRQAGGTNAGFVDAVFVDVLDRSPTSDNRRSLGAMLAASASRTDVAASLLSTSEARRRVVAELYASFLDRPPRSDESRHWVASLGRGTSEQQLGAVLLGSSEYFARFPPEGSGWEEAP